MFLDLVALQLAIMLATLTYIWLFWFDALPGFARSKVAGVAVRTTWVVSSRLISLLNLHLAISGALDGALHDLLFPLQVVVLKVMIDAGFGSLMRHACCRSLSGILIPAFPAWYSKRLSFLSRDKRVS